jgi:ATP-dependent DNA helicase RecG
MTENENQLQKMGLNFRQINAVKYVMENGSITNAVFQQLNHVGKSTATVDLQQLVDLELFSPSTAKGRGSKYTLKN